MRLSSSLALAMAAVVAVAPKSTRAAQLEPQQNELVVSGECRVSTDDASWIAAAVASWETTRRRLIPSRPTPQTIALFFDEQCLYRADVLTSPELQFRAARHEGRIELPSGGDIAAEITSFAAPTATDSVFFVMSLPSVWMTSKAKFPFDMRLFLTAVMIHEMSHVVQFQTYLKQTATVDGVDRLGKKVNDDVVQQRFATDESFSASVDDEARLLFRAAATASIAECRRLAKQALALLHARQAAYYVGDLQALTQLEDIFLTLEGSGQFAAVTWLTSPDGGAISRGSAHSAFGEDVRFWSQRHGLALFLVLERLSPDWRTTIFGAGDRTVLQLLKEALQ